MIRTFTSTPAGPFDRGREFGAAHAAAVRRTVAAYRELLAPLDLEAHGAQALAAIGAAAPALAEEITGMAEGSGCAPRELGAINARTELLARADVAARGECSTVVALPGGGRAPIAVQTWDWFGALAGNWLVWTIPHPDGRVVRTVTEYGIVGKIGVNASGVGVLLNILHHAADGRGELGVPVHVLARRVLDDAAGVDAALALVTGAPVSASSCLTVVGAEDVALSVEVSPAGPGAVSPSPGGVLVHTNHFRAERGRRGCRELVVGPDSYVRLQHLERALGTDACALTEARVLAAMRSHAGGPGAVCCHADPALDPGDQYATLATIALDLQPGDLRVHPGGPCGLVDGVLEPTTPRSQAWASS